ncbi:MAG: zf-HC2 domain-containing protein, partial [Gemmatimonadota bacterium]
MRHPDARALQEYRYRTLSPRRDRRVQRHVADCARCRAELEWLAALPDELRRVTRPPLPADGWQRILERLERGERIALPAYEAARAAGASRGDLGRKAGRPRAIAIAASLVLVSAA